VKEVRDGWSGRRSNATTYNGGLLDCELGIDDISLGNISLYPNPATNEVFVALKDTNFSNFEIKIANSLGQTLQTLNESSLNGSTEVAINVSSYRTGLYFVTIEIDGQSVTKKLVIK
jgi:hypothetical protein